MTHVLNDSPYFFSQIRGDASPAKIFFKHPLESAVKVEYNITTKAPSSSPDKSIC
jgi:hypothetical protein